jgi:hypothetical protein
VALEGKTGYGTTALGHTRTRTSSKPQGKEAKKRRRVAVLADALVPVLVPRVSTRRASFQRKRLGMSVRAHTRARTRLNNENPQLTRREDGAWYERTHLYQRSYQWASLGIKSP